MKDIVNWLLGIEHLAYEFYRYTAEYFIDDQQLHSFLDHTTEDEAWHYHVMASAFHYFHQHQFPTSAITLDDETKSRIEGSFIRNMASATNGTLTSEQLIDCMIETEFSEWNDFFLYVVNSLKIEKDEFEYAASEIQHHLTHIEHFIQHEFDYHQKAEKLKTLTKVYNEKILVVEDDQVVAGLMKAILSKEGTIHLAGNGQEAIDKIEKNFYRLIVTDINMPIMDGITLYKKAVAKYPNLKEIFVFISGHITPAVKSFFKEHGLTYLKKPSPVNDIRRVASEVMFRINS